MKVINSLIKRERCIAGEKKRKTNLADKDLSSWVGPDGSKMTHFIKNVTSLDLELTF